MGVVIEKGIERQTIKMSTVQKVSKTEKDRETGPSLDLSSS